jgi:tetratricopeptide (TPR) repeat protein
LYNTIYPVSVKPYLPPKQQTASGGETAQSQDLPKHPDNKGFERQELPNGKKTTIDYSRSKVNIAQIITDFRNTAQAIGSPEDITGEVETYLITAEEQSFQEKPDRRLIQETLRSASCVLDGFISKTLNKNSKVVENWVEALFLQQVDYKSDPESINPDFLVKMPEKSKNIEPVETPVAAGQPAQAGAKVYVPENPELRKYFLQGKKYSSDPQKALAALGTAMSLAQDTGDLQALSMVCFEIGQIYDKNDNLEEALKYYNRSLINSNDNNLKTKAYYSMAQIYNDFVYFEPAMEHYYAAISHAGEAENLNAQTKSLIDIAGMFAQRYDKEKTRQYYTFAKQIAQETKENKTLGAVYSRCADTMRKLEENILALNDYKESVKYYEKANSLIKTAQGYEKASQVMSKLGNTSKAASLMKMAHSVAVFSGDKEYARKLAMQC